MAATCTTPKIIIIILHIHPLEFTGPDRKQEKNSEEPDEHDSDCNNTDRIVVDELLADDQRPENHQELFNNEDGNSVNDIEPNNENEEASNCQTEESLCFQEKATQEIFTDYNNLENSNSN